MSKLINAMIVIVLAVFASTVKADKRDPAANGIALPDKYKDWRVISVSHRVDNNTMRVILGNDAAIAAARGGKTNPWPNGVVIGKVVWKVTNNKGWDKAIVPGEFVHAEFMLKDTKKYAGTGGWGYARWKGEDLKPHGTDPVSASAECVACHSAAKSRDWVFTEPAKLP